MNAKPFRKQRARFRNTSAPYADKPDASEPSSRSGTGPRGGFPSRKNSALVRFWTKQEHDAAVLFEAFPDIVAFAERPMRLQLREGPHWHAYVPHFMVSLDGRKLAVELSADGQPRTERQQTVADLASRHFSGMGVRLVGLAHWMVRSRPRSTDALKLVRPLLLKTEDADLLRAHDALDSGPVTLPKLADRSGVPAHRLLALVRTRGLVLHGSGPIDSATLLARPGQLGAAL